MKLLGHGKLHQFVEDHADARAWVSGWIAEVEEIQWRIPHDIRGRYATVSFLKDNVVVFNVKGNRYRLVVHVAYNTEIVIVAWIGTHAEYSKRYSG